MKERIRWFSIVIAFFIVFIFQISVSLESNNRGIRFREEGVEFLADSLEAVHSSDERIGILKRREKHDRDILNIYVSPSEEILYSSSFRSKAEKALQYVKENPQLLEPKDAKGLYKSGFLNNEYVEARNYDDGSMFIGVFRAESMVSTALHHFSYTVLAGLVGAFLLYVVLNHFVEQHQEETRYFLQNSKKYVQDPDYKMELKALVKEYEPTLAKEAGELREHLDQLNSRLTGLNDMVDNMMEGVILVGKDRKIISINESAIKLLNASIHINYKGKDLLYLCRAMEFYRAFTHAFDRAKDEIRKIDLDGTIIKFFFDPVFNEKGEFYGMMLLMIDETQQTLAERSRREFTSNVTHELKTPLTSIRGYAELLRTGAVAEADVNRFLDIILDESQKLFELIDAVISMSRLEEKNRIEEYRVTNLELLVREVLRSYQPDFEEKELRVQLRADMDSKLYTHPELMKELITNLVDNATSYNVQGGEINIDLDGSDPEMFKIVIQDTGVGISYDHQKRIFERFYMVDKSRSYNKKSTGLGLAIVKHNVESLKGTIELNSQIHHGTVFVLKFPRNGLSSTQ